MSFFFLGHNSRWILRLTCSTIIQLRKRKSNRSCNAPYLVVFENILLSWLIGHWKFNLTEDVSLSIRTRTESNLVQVNKNAIQLLHVASSSWQTRGDRLKSKGMVGQPGARVVKEGKMESSSYPIPDRAKSFFGFWTHHWPEKSSYIMKLAFSDWDKVGRKLMGNQDSESLDLRSRLKSVVCWSIWKMQESATSRDEVA